jgi:predicted nuclease of predicted toxin-antitoxin system
LKVLFDQNAPRPLARFLEHHQVIRSAELGWSSLKNGELLLAAERDGFEVLVTADRNLPTSKTCKREPSPSLFFLRVDGQR